MDNAKKNFSLLWVDDDIGKMNTFVEALENEGFTIETAAGTEEALKIVSTRDFDVILVDINMPAPDGIELLRFLQQKGVHSKSALGVLSSFLYLDVYRSRLDQLDYPVEIIDKDIPIVQDPRFSELFVKPIKDLAQYGVRYTIQSQKEQLEIDLSLDPFEINLVDFMQKSLLEKDQLVMNAKKMAAAAIQEQFRSGKIWVLFCGSKKQALHTASTPSEIPSEEEIMQFATGQNRAPYQFYKPLWVEDMGTQWSDCNSMNLHDYPTLSLEIGEEVLQVHFDTGAPITFFSYEKLREMNIIPPTTNFGGASRVGYQDRDYFFVPLNIEVLLKCQQTEQIKWVRLRGQAVRDWARSPFSRFCDVSGTCVFTGREPDSPAGYLCIGRSALIGRNVLSENSLIIVLDGKNRQTTFLPRKDSRGH